MLRERSTLIAGVSGVGALLLGVGYLLGGVVDGHPVDSVAEGETEQVG